MLGASEEQIDKAQYLAIDPGETTGWALFDKEGQLIALGQYKSKTAAENTKELDRLLAPHILVCITEDYRNFNHVHRKFNQKAWSRNQTSKNIGSIETICQLRDIIVTLQPASIKTIGYRWAGMDGPPSNHAISHQYDAYVHGVYWLKSNLEGYITPAEKKML